MSGVEGPGVEGGGGGGGGSPGGLTGQVQYNDAGAFGGIGYGTAGQILTSTGAGSAPTMQSAPAVAPAGATTQIQFNKANVLSAASTFTYNDGTNTFVVAETTYAPGVVSFGSAQRWNIFPTLGGSNKVLWDDYYYEFQGFEFKMRLGHAPGYAAFCLSDELDSRQLFINLAWSGATTNGDFTNVPDGQSITFATENGVPAYFGSGSASIAAFGFDASGNLLVLSGVRVSNRSTQIPATGFTITLAAYTTQLVPAGTLATGTINLPATPADGQEIRVSTSQTITALTVSGNGNSLTNAPTTLTAGTGFAYIFNQPTTTWLRLY